MNRSIRAGTVAIGLAATMLAAPARAQEIDFTGSWVPIYHEDGPERIPGPELFDYLGLPINDAARLRAESYDADRILSSIVQLPTPNRTGRPNFQRSNVWELPARIRLAVGSWSSVRQLGVGS